MAAGAEQLEVAEFVVAAAAERNPMVELEAAVGAATGADAIAFVDTAADLTPCPTAADLASSLPVIASSRAAVAVACLRERTAAETRSG